MQDSSQSPSFIHLRCHSEYSIVDGIVRIKDYVNAAQNDAMPALALTDLIFELTTLRTISIS